MSREASIIRRVKRDSERGWVAVEISDSAQNHSSESTPMATFVATGLLVESCAVSCSRYAALVEDADYCPCRNRSR
jgi:hypothetical protein